MKLSVIIPNYNNEKYLNKCLDSIEKQTFKDYEVIIIDDGSTDNSVKIIKEYQKQSKLNITLIQQYNQNASIARNRGLEICKGEYIYFLDSDDMLYDKNVFSTILSKIKDNDLLIGNFYTMDEQDNLLDKKIIKEKIIKEFPNNYKYCTLPPAPSNKLYKRNIIKDNNLYFANVRIGQDLNFYLKYLSVSQNIILIDDFIYKYRINSSSMSQSTNLNFLDITNTFKDIKKFYKQNQKYEDYEKYITTAEIQHYLFQLSKLTRYNSKKIRKLIYNYITIYINNINFSKANKNNTLKRKLEIYKLIKLFKLIYLSKFYQIYKTT